MMRVALARAVAAAFWLATSIYALLSAIPFASKHFIEPGLLPELNAFAARHGLFSLAIFVVVVGLLAPWLRTRHRGAMWFAAAWALSIGIELMSPGLAALEPAWTSIVVSAAALVPPVWLAQLDFRKPSGAADAAMDADAGIAADFAACMLAGLAVAIAHGAASLSSGISSGGDVGRAAMLHLVVFGAIFALLSLIRGFARISPRPAVAERWLTRVVLAIAFGIFVDRIILSPLSYTGVRSTLMSAALGVALALLAGPKGTSVQDGVVSAIGGLAPAWTSRSPWRAALWIAGVVLAIVAGEHAVSGSDWNFAVVKTLAFASWLVVLAGSLRAVPAIRSAAAAGRPAALIPFVACLILLGAQQLVARAGQGSAAHGSAAADASTRLILDALAPEAVAGRGLYDYLLRNTNIARNVQVLPVDVELAPLSGPSAARPHIFLFVIDSLRRDYLSPYNKAVTFTPSLEKFAAESTVFERAFTRYGATGLSVPSIWTGGMLLHKQYVTPFAPMNSLAKLLRAENYTEWSSVDPILEIISPPAERREPLDAAMSVKDYRLCGTLDEVRSRLDRLKGSAPATFVYSLPQDIHVSSIAREGSRAVDNGRYDGFNAAYASRVHRLDECFGRFIDDLKAHDVYDNSLIVVTADHGDSLGEEGRMGHAYTIFPEVIQIPLIVHLPSGLAAAYTADAKALAFTSDLAPSLYRLLGHEPRQPAPFFGQPLFRRAGSAPVTRQAVEVVASSYGSVYGALLDDAARLYIIDGVSLREYEYELDGSGAGRARSVNAADRDAAQRAIRATVSGIAKFFQYPAGVD